MMIPKFVFINGTFDILHPGHIALLDYAQDVSYGGYVCVAIDSDRRVKEKKGLERPHFTQEERKKMLLALRFVDRVEIFDSDEELENLIKKTEPDIMIVGSDWQGKQVIGSQYAKELRFFKRQSQYSTTRILNHGKLS